MVNNYCVSIEINDIYLFMYRDIPSMYVPETAECYYLTKGCYLTHFRYLKVDALFSARIGCFNLIWMISTYCVSVEIYDMFLHLDIHSLCITSTAPATLAPIYPWRSRLCPCGLRPPPASPAAWSSPRSSRLRPRSWRGRGWPAASSPWAQRACSSWGANTHRYTDWHAHTRTHTQSKLRWQYTELSFTRAISYSK